MIIHKSDFHSTAGTRERILTRAGPRGLYPRMPSLSDTAVDELYGEPPSSLYRAMRSRCAGGIDLSWRPCWIPPWSTPTRFIESNCRKSVYACQRFIDRTYIVGSVGVVVDTAEERGCRVLANVLDQQMATTRVLVDKVRDIVNEASDDDERPLDTLVLDCSID